ncbi:hypothetical protein [Streptomyces lydicus]
MPSSRRRCAAGLHRIAGVTSADSWLVAAGTDQGAPRSPSASSA